MARDWYPNKSNKKGAAAPSKHGETKQRHARERRRTHERHASERADMNSRHEAEISDMAATHDGEIADASAGPAGPPNGTGSAGSAALPQV